MFSVLIKKIIAVFFLLNVFVIQLIKSQAQDFPFHNFQNITTAQGLSSNSVRSLIQDHNGFMWFASENGLSRYDGYSFKNFGYHADDANSIPPGFYYSMFEDKNGIIWLWSTTQGFFSFNQVTEKFKRYHHQPGNANSLASDLNEGGCVQDSSGIIWIGTSEGLNSFNPVTDKFELFAHHDNDSSSLSFNNSQWLTIDDKNNLWIAFSDNTIECFNTATKKVVKRFRSSFLPGNKVTSSFTLSDKSRNGNLLIATNDNGFYMYNIYSEKWTHYFHDEKNPGSLNSNKVTYLFEDSNNNLWVINDMGIDFYQSKSNTFIHPQSIEKLNSLTSIVSMLLQDKQGKMWMTTESNGIITCDPVTKKFEIFKSNASKQNSLSSNSVSAIFQKQPGELFIGCAGGVVIFNEKDKTFKPFEIIESNTDVFKNNVTWQIYRDSKNRLWFCTLYGLFCYDEKTKEHISYRANENDSTSLAAHSATNILEDAKGNFWITTFGGGLHYLDLKTGKMKRYMADANKNQQTSNSLAFPVKDKNGILNIGSWFGGLVTFNPATEIFKNYLHVTGDASSLSSNITQPFFEDINGIIWIGTVSGGLNAFNPATGKFRSFTIADGLPDNTVVSLSIDNYGKAWAGTHNGLSTFVIPQNPFDKNCKLNFRNYNMSDGLPGNDLSPLSSLMSDDGKLYFGTLNAGFFNFNPSDLKDNNFVPSVYITGFSLMNKEVSISDSSILKSPIEFTKEIALTYKQNILSFTFAALNFIHPEKNKYAYQLEGYDKDWIYTDATKRFATYTNLDPGEYIFKVKGSNNDGAWNEKPTELKIIITPPFWKTVWFKMLMLFIIAATAWKFYRYRIAQILLLERIRNKIASDLHDDIGSTLNSISIFSEVAKKDSSRRDHALNMIGESSRKIIESMSDIVWTINPENDSFDKIIFRMRSLSHNLLKAKTIDCTFRADESLNELKLKMEIRRNLYLIFKEALNNLVKYSNATRASVLVSHQNKSVTFIIRDDGIGFDNSIEHSGNGLNNMKKRAAEIGAMLLIESKVGMGTSIELNLKI